MVSSTSDSGWGGGGVGGDASAQREGGGGYVPPAARRRARLHTRCLWTAAYCRWRGGGGGWPPVPPGGGGGGLSTRIPAAASDWALEVMHLRALLKEPPHPTSGEDWKGGQRGGGGGLGPKTLCTGYGELHVFPR